MGEAPHDERRLTRCARGPWGKPDQWILLGSEVRAVFKAIEVNQTPEQRYAITAALGLVGDHRGWLSHRKVDRALQLRKAGLIRHRDGRWECSMGDKPAHLVDPRCAFVLPTKPLSPEEEAAFRRLDACILAALNDEAEGLRNQGLIDDMFSFLDATVAGVGRKTMSELLRTWPMLLSLHGCSRAVLDDEGPGIPLRLRRACVLRPGWLLGARSAGGLNETAAAPGCARDDSTHEQERLTPHRRTPCPSDHPRHRRRVGPRADAQRRKRARWSRVVYEWKWARDDTQGQGDRLLDPAGLLMERQLEARYQAGPRAGRSRIPRRRGGQPHRVGRTRGAVEAPRRGGAAVQHPSTTSSTSHPHRVPDGLR